MSLNVIHCALPEILIIEPKVFGDDRGLFYDSFNARLLEEATGLKRTFVQDNHSPPLPMCSTACTTKLGIRRASWSV